MRLQARNDTELLFPVYDTLTGTGSNADYHVIAWVGFHLHRLQPDQRHQRHDLGLFTRVIWAGCQRTGPPGQLSRPRRPRRRPHQLTQRNPA